MQAARDNGFSQLFVMGDFNLPHLDILLNTPLNRSLLCNEYYNAFLNLGLTHHINLQTHISGNRLDLLLSPTPELTYDVISEQDAYPSDHFLILFSMDI